MWKISREEELRLGDSKVSLRDGELVMEDLYSSKSISLDVDHASVRPYPPAYVPTKITDYLMIKLDKPMIPKDGQEIWLSAPYDLAVELNGRVLGFLSPFKVKYTLYGPTTEGIVCRYHPGSDNSGIEAKVKVLFRVKLPREVDRIVFPIKELDIFSDGNSLYYEAIEVTVDEYLLVELKNQPPVKADPVYPSEGTLKLAERLMSKYRMVW